MACHGIRAPLKKYIFTIATALALTSERAFIAYAASNPVACVVDSGGGLFGGTAGSKRSALAYPLRTRGRVPAIVHVVRPVGTIGTSNAGIPIDP